MKKIAGRNNGTILQSEKGDVLPGAGRPAGSFSISRRMKELIIAEGGWLKFDEVELLDEAGKPTGVKSKARVKLPHGEKLTIVAMQAAEKAGSDPRYLKALEMVWERNDGKVPLPIEHNYTELAELVRSKFPFEVPDEGDQ